jgi:hypothetical protein
MPSNGQRGTAPPKGLSVDELAGAIKSLRVSKRVQVGKPPHNASPTLKEAYAELESALNFNAHIQMLGGFRHLPEARRQGLSVQEVPEFLRDHYFEPVLVLSYDDMVLKRALEIGALARLGPEERIVVAKAVSDALGLERDALPRVMTVGATISVGTGRTVRACVNYSPVVILDALERYVTRDAQTQVETTDRLAAELIAIQMRTSDPKKLIAPTVSFLESLASAETSAVTHLPLLERLAAQALVPWGDGPVPPEVESLAFSLIQTEPMDELTNAARDVLTAMHLGVPTQADAFELLGALELLDLALTRYANRSVNLYGERPMATERLKDTCDRLSNALNTLRIAHGNELEYQPVLNKGEELASELQRMTKHSHS